MNEIEQLKKEIKWRDEIIHSLDKTVESRVHLDEFKKEELMKLIEKHSELISEPNPENPSHPKWYYKIRESDLRLKVFKL